MQFPRGECRICSSPVSYQSVKCAHCGAPNQPNPVATIAALLAIGIMGTAIALVTLHFAHRGEQVAGESAERSAAGASAGQDGDYGWLVTAMAECDAQAKLNSETLHFLVIPVTPTGLSLPGWSPDPIVDVGSSAKLLSSSDALIGLRNGALTLYPNPIAFQAADPNTNTVYKWKPEVGVAALNAKRSDLQNLKLGFEMPGVTDDVEWGPTFGIKKDMCYWINLIVLPRNRQ